MKFIALLFGLSFVQCVYADNCREAVDSILRQGVPDGEKLDVLLKDEGQCSGDEYYELVRAQLYARKREFNKAIEVIAAVSDKKKYRYEFLLLDAKAHAMIGETGIAITEVRTFLQQKPDDYKAHLFLGEMLFSENEYSGAIESYISSIKLKPTPKAYVELAKALYVVDNCGEAIVSIEQAASLDKSTYANVQAMTVASRCYAKQGKFLVARNLLGVLLENNPQAESDEKFKRAVSMLRNDIKVAKASGNNMTDADKFKLDDVKMDNE